jgi:putative membrane protein insertion efficiency factor
MKVLAALARELLVFLIGAYRVAVSPFLGPACRFEPSCSNFAIEAVSKHGALWGGWLAMRRVLRCHPLHPGGLDPVP